MGQHGRRVTTWLERAALGGIMTVAALVVERRLLKALRGRGEDPRDASIAPTDVELSAPAQDVDQ